MSTNHGNGITSHNNGTIRSSVSDCDVIMVYCDVIRKVLAMIINRCVGYGVLLKGRLDWKTEWKTNIKWIG